MQGNDSYRGNGVHALFKQDKIHLKARSGILNTSRTMKVEYSSIENFEISKTLMAKIIIHTNSNTYKMSKCSISDVDSLYEFVEKRRNQTAQNQRRSETSTSGESSPADRLQKLNELYEQGAITQRDFEDKKDEIIDEL